MVLKLFQQERPSIPAYEILEHVGAGGMGSVYRGRHRSSGQTVAVKVIAAGLEDDLEALQRFEQEFRVASKLLHPNIVQVLDFGRTPETMFLVMEYINGPSLGRRIDDSGPLPEAEAVALITQVAQALDYAHRHWMIHRDVKPDNVLLRGSRQVKLTDFGLVKDVVGDRQLTEPLARLGTTHFMAPEQSYDAKRVDHRSDIYSLGATLYMAVTGKKPFWTCRSLPELMRQVIRGGLTPAREVVPTLSEEVEEAIRRAMSLEPADRPGSCREFVQSLKRGGRKRRPPGAHTPAPAHVPAAPGGSDNRASARYAHGSGASCGVKVSLHAEGAETEERWPAFVQDVSRGGLALVLGRRLEAGTVVAVDLPLADGTATRSLEGRVVQVQPSSYGHWRIGCLFPKPLSQAELQGLL
jgi:serine/threonine protein kinase